jgi:hypothetical protein
LIPEFRIEFVQKILLGSVLSDRLLMVHDRSPS